MRPFYPIRLCGSVPNDVWYRTLGKGAVKLTQSHAAELREAPESRLCSMEPSQAVSHSARTPVGAIRTAIFRYGTYFALSRFAKSRYAPGTPAGNWRNHAYAVKM